MYSENQLTSLTANEQHQIIEKIVKSGILNQPFDAGDELKIILNIKENKELKKGN